MLDIRPKAICQWFGSMKYWKGFWKHNFFHRTVKAPQ